MTSENRNRKNTNGNMNIWWCLNSFYIIYRGNCFFLVLLLTLYGIKQLFKCCLLTKLYNKINSNIHTEPIYVAKEGLYFQGVDPHNNLYINYSGL